MHCNISFALITLYTYHQFSGVHRIFISASCGSLPLCLSAEPLRPFSHPQTQAMASTFIGIGIHIGLPHPPPPHHSFIHSTIHTDSNQLETHSLNASSY